MLRRFVAAVLLCVASTAANAHPSFPWCGYYARFNLVSTDPGERFNSACEWLRYGAPTTAQVGAIVIWCTRGHHHVGKIVGGEPGAWLIKSGNDGHAIRTRVRSVAGAVFRWPS